MVLSRETKYRQIKLIVTWLAKHNKLIYTILFAAVLLMLAFRLLQAKSIHQ